MDNSPRYVLTLVEVRDNPNYKPRNPYDGPTYGESSPPTFERTIGVLQFNEEELRACRSALFAPTLIAK